MAAGESQSQEQIIEIPLPDTLLQVANGRLIDIERPRMQKVPALLRLQNGDQEYDPLVVSLGPYHHGKSQLQLAEKFKLKALEMFVARSSGKTIEFFYNKVLEQVNFCRDCYFKDSTSDYDDRKFAQMMLLDSCFIINHILCYLDDAESIATTCSYLGQSHYVNLGRDIFLLENQIPLRLIKLLFRLQTDDGRWEGLLHGFLFPVNQYVEHVKLKGLVGRDDDDDDDRPFHILDGFWLEDTSELPVEMEKSISSRCVPYSCTSTNLRIFNWLSRRKKEPMLKFFSLKNAYSFRSATDLKAKGIYCGASSEWSRRKINFKSGCFFASLDIPVRFVTVNTKSFLMNLIAYELLFAKDAKMERPMTAYVDFMKSLIDSPADVKELRERKILFTTLGCDEDVVDLFNGINTYDPGSDITLHEEVKVAIEEHYNNKAKTWLAELLHTYFRNPWSAIALLAAVFLLILTVIQTYFAAQPNAPDRNKEF